MRLRKCNQKFNNEAQESEGALRNLRENGWLVGTVGESVKMAF